MKTKKKFIKAIIHQSYSGHSPKIYIFILCMLEFIIIVVVVHSKVYRQDMKHKYRVDRRRR